MDTPVRLRAGQRVRVVRGLLTGPGTIADDLGAPYFGANGVRCWPVQFDGTPGASVADWLIGPAGVVTLHTQGVSLTGVAPVFDTIRLAVGGHQWGWCTLGVVVRDIATLAREAARQQQQDLRPVAFCRLIPRSPLVDGPPPPHIADAARIPQFCFVDERDPLVQAPPIPALHLTDSPDTPMRIRGAAMWTDSDGQTHTTY
jgi:hypothetical protein